MGEIAAEWKRVSDAFVQPSLALLHRRQARAVIAIFRAIFPPDVDAVPAERMYRLVAAYREELEGIEDPSEVGLPTGDARELCMRWTREQWLDRIPDDDGGIVFKLRSPARDALQQVGRLVGERSYLSEHRIATIVETARRFNAKVNPNRDERMRILHERISALTEEYELLQSDAPMEAARPSEMHEGFAELLRLISGLPSDFARVQEEFTLMRRDLIDSFAKEQRPTGEVVSEYLQRAESLRNATAEGRAFDGAFALLRDDALFAQLRSDVVDLLAHPLAGDALAPDERAALRSLERMISTGILQVAKSRSRVTKQLTEYILTHDSAEDRELDQVLRQLNTELARWLSHAGPRARVPVSLAAEAVEVGNLYMRFQMEDPDDGPEPDAGLAGSRPAPLDLEQLLQQGGPKLPQLEAAIDERLVANEEGWSLGELFEQLDPKLRRPVDILGLLQLAARRPDLERSGETEDYTAIRPDGSRRTLIVPRIRARRDDAERSEQ